jgi:RNA polymerase sigma-70 factor (ECF subfamily)
MPESEEDLLRLLLAGDDEALAPVFELHRERLRRMVHFRLDPRLVGRVDAEDVVQEAYLDSQKRLSAWRADPRAFHVWLRLVVKQTMIDVHRRHLGTAMRDAAQERGLAQSQTLSRMFAARVTSPSQAVLRLERQQQVEAALAAMDEIDREVLMLRHFEELSNKEVAEVLGIQENAASNRYVRALGRLKGMLSDLGTP